MNAGLQILGAGSARTLVAFATRHIFILLLGASHVLYCQGVKAQNYDLDGTWVGTWSYSYTGVGTGCEFAGGGAVTNILTFANGSVSGSATVDGLQVLYYPGCAPGGYDNTAGSISGTNVGTSVSLRFSVNAISGPLLSGAWSFSFNGAVSGSTISGTVTNSPSGTNFSGTMSFTRITQPYKDLGCLSCQTAVTDPSVGNPIRLGNGNKFEEVHDYQTAGINPLSFSRYYNSQGDPASSAVTLGVNWRSSYDRYLRIAGSVSIAERPDGQELTFNNNGVSWTSDSDVDIKLVQSGSAWILTNNDDTVETYNAGGSGVALLASMEARDGYRQTLQYNGNNQLMSVTDSFGRKLEFTYQSNLLHTVTTPSGLLLTYGYDSSGKTPSVLDRLVSVGYSTSPQTSQSYLYENSSLPFALTGIIDENTNRFATWTYDLAGRAVSSEHAGGADLTTIAYNDDGSRNVTNALGLTTVYKFATLQGAQKITEIDRLATATTPGAKMTYAYDTNGYIASVSDWKTNVTSEVNDIRGQPLIVKEAVGTTVTRTNITAYLTNFHLPLQIIAPRTTNTFAYDTNGNMLVLTETDASTQTVPYSTKGETRSWTNTFDALGHLLTSKGPRTDVLATNKYTYDATNNLRTVADPLGHVTQISNYNGSGLPLTMVDPNGVITRFTYDIRDRLLTRSVLASTGNATNRFGYDAAGQLTSIILPDGSLLHYQYDAAHRLQSVNNSFGENIIYTLDEAGNIIERNIENAGAGIVNMQSRVFDQLSRMLKQIGASSQTNTFAYDGDGNQTSFRDGLNNSTMRAFDALNRLVTVVDPLEHPTGFSYDAQNNLVSVTDARSLVTSYVYDGFGHVIQETSPDKGTTIYYLDKAGNRTNEMDGRGVVTLRTFDKLNRVTAETFPASSAENIAYTYDATTGGNLGIGRLTGFADETGSTTLTYNQRGDVISTTRTIGGHAYTTGYGYDLADDITNITYPSGHITIYGRDGQGRINSVTYRPSVSGAPTVLASGVAYMPFGPVSGLVYGNGLLCTNIFDKDYRPTAIATMLGTTNIQNLDLIYNGANNIEAIYDNLAPERDQAFSYDPDYRLTEAVGIYGTDAYTYDADGNRQTRTAQGVTESYSYSPTANQLLSTVKGGVTRSFSYTLNGNVAGDNRGTTTNLLFGYNARNRYNGLTNGAAVVAAYKHNARGERLIKTVGAATTHYHFDEKGHLLAESQSSGALIREYVWLDDRPLAQIEASGTVHYIHPDHLNAPQKMTDATRAIVWSIEQQPFGETVPPSFTSAGYNASKQFQMTVNGGPNYKYVVQASTNVSPAHWVSLTTNGAPFSFTDTNASAFRTRFYRVVAMSSSSNTVSVTQNLRFPGQYFDAESSLNYNMMRDYDSTLGRYIQSDPIGLKGGLNSYSYGLDNPVEHFDFLGLYLNLNLFPQDFTYRNLLLNINSTAIYNPGAYTVGGHGDSANFYGPENQPISPSQLANMISNDPNYVTGEPIYLYSCNTGFGVNSYAQQLSDALGTVVFAPDNYAWYFHSGVVYPYQAINSDPTQGPDYSYSGHFNRFYPYFGF